MSQDDCTMRVTQAELDSFHRFASERLEAGNGGFTWDELFILWDSAQHRGEVNEAIRRGLADIDAGRYEPAEVAMDEIREDFGHFGSTGQQVSTQTRNPETPASLSGR